MKAYTPQCIREVFETFAISPGKPPTHTKDDQVDIIRGIFHQKESIKVI